MKELSKIEINSQEVILGVHKTFLAIRLLEDNQIEEAKESLSLALGIFQKLLLKKLKLLPIAYEIASETKEYLGGDWSTQTAPYRKIIILRQLLPIKEYALFSAKALDALELWRDKAKAQKELQSALSTLSYELVSFKV